MVLTKKLKRKELPMEGTLAKPVSVTPGELELPEGVKVKEPADELVAEAEAKGEEPLLGKLPGMMESLLQKAKEGEMPVFGEGLGEIPKLEVEAAPPYEVSPEQIAWEETISPELRETIEMGGRGIPEETQAQMIQAQTDVIKAREEESLRVMRNTMERRGITNSGFIGAYEQNIKADTTIAIAGSIRDVQIKSAFMKMASYEKAIGQGMQFLGYLSEQSQLAYAPEFATWQAEQMATMQQWQGQMDVYKMEINQAYTEGNMEKAARIAREAREDQQKHETQMAEMEIEAANKRAAAEGAGGFVGMLLGWLIPGS